MNTSVFCFFYLFFCFFWGGQAVCYVSSKPNTGVHLVLYVFSLQLRTSLVMLQQNFATANHTAAQQ